MIGDPISLTQYLRDSSPSVYNRTERTVFLVLAYPDTAAGLYFRCEIFEFSTLSSAMPTLELLAYPGLPQFFDVLTRAELASLCVLTFRIAADKTVKIRRNGIVRFANTFTGDFDPDASYGREFRVVSGVGQTGETAQLGEWIVFDTALPDAECGKIENYLMHKFGIV
ncbi:hypothetical protein G3N56_07785 [Desulfovibrio sulfodismutans]|uniref:Uncharacterized protein n=1 Tax=Desulfolutivibrio sulfodismutans TaxID=63561 RepID=A0A7K3NKE0_9BACT|nr:hypothetical protein [Desulfolutivibrio sulfodismutans]NDY56642.1 hypothetical protein [Desulfolutivibrio sulfodismutans]QLA11257.1 hypothetical protein GD606_02670 [Desulfolutivibrio sulfodismutans DSM 3696]